MHQLSHKNALVVTGMRQVGKTTLLKQVFAEIKNEPKLWFDFDNPLDQKVFENEDYRAIYLRLKQMAGDEENKRLHVFIDEIQNFPEITKIIKVLIDEFRVKFLVTGSSNYYLKNLFPESLSGRKFLHILPPLSFAEWLYFKDKINEKSMINWPVPWQQESKDLIAFKKHEIEYDEYLRFGGFPEVILTANYEMKMEILKNIFASFFEKDLKILGDLSDSRELRDLILLLAPRVGSTIDISRLAAELGTHRNKVYSYLVLLEGVFFIQLLPKFSKSIDKQVAGGKKVYFRDTGILSLLGGLNIGQIFENSVVNQLSAYGALSFYNQRNTAEIDVILNNKIGFEIKTNGTDGDLRKLEKLGKKLKITPNFIISKKFHRRRNFIFPQMI